MAKTDNNETLAGTEERINRIRTLVGMGRNYTHAALAGVAYELWLHTTPDGKRERGIAAHISRETGIDPATVSRVSKQLKLNATKSINGKRMTFAKALVSVDWDTVADGGDAFALAALIGDKWLKNEPPKSNKSDKADKSDKDDAPRSKAVQERDESIDVMELLTAWLKESTPKQFAARASQIQNLLAELAAERDIAA